MSHDSPVVKATLGEREHRPASTAMVHNAIADAISEATKEKDAEIRGLRTELAMWKPLTDAEAEAALEEAEGEPLSEERIEEIVKFATDPAVQLPNSDQMQMAAKIKALTADRDRLQRELDKAKCHVEELKVEVAGKVRAMGPVLIDRDALREALLRLATVANDWMADHQCAVKCDGPHQDCICYFCRFAPAVNASSALLRGQSGGETPTAPKEIRKGDTNVIDDNEEVEAVNAAKRLGVRWCPWMGDWFVSWSPRNDNSNAEGSWYHWAQLAAKILKHPFTEVVAPELYRPDLPAKDIYTETVTLPKERIAEELRPASPQEGVDTAAPAATPKEKPMSENVAEADGPLPDPNRGKVGTATKCEFGHSERFWCDGLGYRECMVCRAETAENQRDDLASENKELRAERDAAIEKAASHEGQLVRISQTFGKDARHAEDGTIAGMVESSLTVVMAERDRLRAELARVRERRCEGCGLSEGGYEYIKVRVTNGVLTLCRQCLDDVNSKNPATAAAIRERDEARETARVYEQSAANAQRKLQTFEDAGMGRYWVWSEGDARLQSLTPVLVDAVSMQSIIAHRDTFKMERDEARDEAAAERKEWAKQVERARTAETALAKARAEVERLKAADAKRIESLKDIEPHSIHEFFATEELLVQAQHDRTRLTTRLEQAEGLIRHVHDYVGMVHDESGCRLDSQQKVTCKACIVESRLATFLNPEPAKETQP